MLVGRIGPERLERRGAVRVHGLEYRHAARREAVRRKLQEALEQRVRQMLDYLRREDRRHRRRLESLEIVDRIRQDGVMSLLAAPLDELFVQLQAARADTAFAQQVEKLTAAGADVEHPLGLVEHAQVLRLPFADEVLAAAKDVLEPDVGEIRLFRRPVEREHSLAVLRLT